MELGGPPGIDVGGPTGTEVGGPPGIEVGGPAGIDDGEPPGTDVGGPPGVGPECELGGLVVAVPSDPEPFVLAPVVPDPLVDGTAPAQ